MQTHIRISICLQRVFCLEGQCALNHLPQRFCTAIQGKMYEKKTVDQYVLSSLPLYSSEATHPLCNHKITTWKSPNHFVPLQLVQFLGEYGLESRYSIFHIYQYLSVPHNIKDPQEERMEELQTSWHTDLLMGSCLGLKPSDLASQKYFSNMRCVSNFVLK